MTVSINGLGVSRGIAIGRASILGRNQSNIVKQTLTLNQIDSEVARYNNAVNLAISQLEKLKIRTDGLLASNVKSIINTHILMLNDAAFSDDTIVIINTQQCNAEWALKLQSNALIEIFDAMEDPYLRSRKDDILHVSKQILRNLTTGSNSKGIKNSLKDSIVITHEVSPAEIVLFHDQQVKGIISTTGGPSSHTSIMARSLGIPTIVGGHQCLDYIKHGEITILDGDSGSILFDADTTTIEHYRQLDQSQLKKSATLQKLKQLPALSQDKQRITLLANIGQRSDIQSALDFNIDGIGLYRTELLFLQKESLPSEQEQLDAYLHAIKLLAGKPLTIRTLDIGADKKQASRIIKVKPPNPALSLRGIRLCLQDLELFTPHLRAILRASYYGPVKIMIPMISSLHEIFQFKNLLSVLKKELNNQNLRFDENIQIGGMIEVPAAALCARQYIEQLDFLSIGTNDLIQYTLAIDRTDDSVNYLYDPLHPAILRLIHEIIACGADSGKEITMCGEMAGDPRLTRLLLCMGLTHFSMQTPSLLEVKDIIDRTNLKKLQLQASKIPGLTTTDQIADFLELINCE